jgi:hypothetical protein
MMTGILSLVIGIVLITILVCPGYAADNKARDKARGFLITAKSLEKQGNALEPLRQRNDPKCMRGIYERKAAAEKLRDDIDAANLPREYSWPLGLAASHLVLCVVCLESVARNACEQAHINIIEADKTLNRGRRNK